MNNKFNVKDSALQITRALPAAASSTVTSTALDLGHTANGAPLERGEILVSAPAVTTTMVPDTRTMTYNLIASANADLSSPVTVVSGLIVQTGAGGAGAAAATARYKPASDSLRYYGLQIVSGGSTTDSSTVSGQIEWVS